MEHVAPDWHARTGVSSNQLLTTPPSKHDLSWRTKPLHVIKVAGNTFYEIGYKTGTSLKQQLHEFFTNSSDLNQVFLPFLTTDDGRKFYQGFLEATQLHCADELQELRGLSDATGIEFQKIFIMNIRPEFNAFLRQYRKPNSAANKPNFDDETPEITSNLPAKMTNEGELEQECTTILLNSTSVSAVVHDEDNSADFGPYSYMTQTQLRQANGLSIDFTAYSYPGILVGNTFGFNSHGVVVTTNALSQAGPPIFGVPRYFFNHMILLRAKSVDDALQIIKTTPLASGFSLNIADRSGDVANIELAAQNTGNAKFDIVYAGKSINADEQQNNFDVRLYHYNMYDRMKNVPQIAANIISSQHRAARATSMLPANTIDDAKLILGDTADLEYPIYRTPVEGADQGCTLATAVFDLRAHKLSVYRSNPRTANEESASHFHIPSE